MNPNTLLQILINNTNRVTKEVTGEIIFINRF